MEKSWTYLGSALVAAGCCALPPAVWAGADAGPSRGMATRTRSVRTVLPGAATTSGDGKLRSNDQPSPSASSTLQSVVVTASPIALQRLDASYSIVTADRARIRNTSPFSAADLMNLSPGIWAESSTGGGNAGKVFVAGYVMSMGAPFLTAMIDGVPLFGMPQASFLTNLQLLRLDDTVERMEIVQGGPGAIFGPGQMGATAHFILRRGTVKPSGDVAATYGSGSLKRLDGFYGFQLAPGWLASIGGFHRTSSGIRDPQFDADKGGQLTATLGHAWSHGSLMLWVRVLGVSSGVDGVMLARTLPGREVFLHARYRF